MSVATGVVPSERPTTATPATPAMELDARRRARGFVNQLHVALKTASTFDASNEVYVAAMDELHQISRRLVAGQDEVRFEIVFDELYVNKSKVRMEVGAYYGVRYLSEQLAKADVGAFVIGADSRRADVVAMVHLLLQTHHEAAADAVAADSAAASDTGADRLNQLAAERGLIGIAFEAPREIDRSRGGAGHDRRRRALQTYEEALRFLKQEMTNFPTGEVLNIRRGKRLVQAMVDCSHDRPGEFAFAGLAAVRNYHPYTFNHIVNVCLLSIAFGQRLGFDRHQLCELGMGALYHDIGKLSIPTDILNKDCPLTDEEWDLVRQHPLLATQKLLTLQNMTEAGMKRLLVALEHHMGYDLKGYPKFRRWNRLHIYSRVVAICDAYDAMVSRRSYNQPMLPTEALEALVRHAGTRFDPLLVKAFINSIGLYPIGSLVLLTSGELAVVTALGGAPEEPQVRLVRDRAGLDLGGRLVELSAGREARRIVKCLHPSAENVNVARYTLWSTVETAG